MLKSIGELTAPLASRAIDEQQAPHGITFLVCVNPIG